MNESEKIKEQILTNIKTYLITDLTETQINSVIIVLSRELQDVVITNQKDLPSVDVVDNNKICNSKYYERNNQHLFISKSISNSTSKNRQKI